LGLVAIIGAVVLGSFVNFLIVFLSARRYVRFRLYADFDIWKRMIVTAFPIAISVVLNLVYLKIGTIFLSVFKTQQEVGIFGQPFKILEVLVSFPAIFAGLIMPALSKRYHAGDLAGFTQVFRKGFDVMAVVVLPLVVGTLFYAHELIVLVSSEEFAVSADVLRILIFATAMIFFGNLFGNTVVAINKQKSMVWGYLASAVVAVVVNYVLVMRYSYIGAAYSTVISETMIAVIAMIVIYRFTRIAPQIVVFAKALGSSLIMGAVLYLLPFDNLFAGVAIGGAVYIGLMVVSKGITKDVITEVLQLRKEHPKETPISSEV
jgi:O-antigen/teichoic acid export membrane protein